MEIKSAPTREELVSNIRRGYAYVIWLVSLFIAMTITSAYAIAAERTVDNMAPSRWAPLVFILLIVMLVFLWMIISSLGRDIQRLIDYSSNPEESPEYN